MRIAQIAPPIESVPPRLYGGTERIVSYLCEELVAHGHDVTLFASGDSKTSARLVPVCEQALRLDQSVKDIIPYYILMMDKAHRMAAEFDILHFHIDQFHFPVFRELASKTVTTLHGRQDLPDLQKLYAGFPEMPLVSISLAQRAPLTGANFVGNVLHGLPRDLLSPTLNARGGYLAFLGRIAPEKRVDRAIEIARAVGLPLKIAAKVDRVDEKYFRDEIEPLLAQPGIEYIGEIDDRTKGKFLGNARALLFPIDWPEPFGLVLIEAMACGTPVLAFNRGAVPEVVDQGVTGFVVESVGEAICKIGSVLALDRGQVRRRFEERFTTTRMMYDYLGIYAALLERRPPAKSPRISPRIVADRVPEIAAGRAAGIGLPESVVPVVSAGEPQAGSS
ncbi:MAG TPA: glycosyltransferase family 4 protein [Hyphomicrobiaceae bacterium]|nr:glycosyltransferase family 4 protein [Hyphomicrobiaceae bacterium]